MDSANVQKKKDLGCIHFQETHFMNEEEAIQVFRRLGGKLVGFSKCLPSEELLFFDGGHVTKGWQYTPLDTQ